MNEKVVKELKSGVRVINCTPHELRFEDGTVVEPSGYLLQAKMREKKLSDLVYEIRPVPTEKGTSELEEIERKYGNDIIILGSAISAQAFPGRVKMTVLTKPRAAVKEKICRIDKFSVYPAKER